jgi:cystathionine beta-lyase/cystathionine gamma-synthase
METVEVYLARKKEELELLSSVLSDPLAIRLPKSVAEAIEQKFHLAAALKAEHVLHDWVLTETAWTHSSRLRSGPFEFKYDYQRADLEVKGPSFYALESQLSSETVYTASGMAAISALLMATAPVFSEADIVTMPNSYGETTELIDGHARHLGRVQLGTSLGEITNFSGSRPRILLLDSCVSAGAFAALLK